MTDGRSVPQMNGRPRCWLARGMSETPTTRTITLIILVAFVMSERRVGFSRA